MRRMVARASLTDRAAISGNAKVSMTLVCWATVSLGVETWSMSLMDRRPGRPVPATARRVAGRGDMAAEKSAARDRKRQARQRIGASLQPTPEEVGRDANRAGRRRYESKNGPARHRCEDCGHWRDLDAFPEHEEGGWTQHSCASCRGEALPRRRKRDRAVPPLASNLRYPRDVLLIYLRHDSHRDARLDQIRSREREAGTLTERDWLTVDAVLHDYVSRGRVPRTTMELIESHRRTNGDGAPFVGECLESRDR